MARDVLEETEPIVTCYIMFLQKFLLYNLVITPLVLCSTLTKIHIKTLQAQQSKTLRPWYLINLKGRSDKRIPPSVDFVGLSRGLNIKHIDALPNPRLPVIKRRRRVITRNAEQ